MPSCMFFFISVSPRMKQMPRIKCRSIRNLSFRMRKRVQINPPKKINILIPIILPFYSLFESQNLRFWFPVGFFAGNDKPLSRKKRIWKRNHPTNFAFLFPLFDFALFAPPKCQNWGYLAPTSTQQTYSKYFFSSIVKKKTLLFSKLTFRSEIFVTALFVILNRDL